MFKVSWNRAALLGLALWTSGFADFLKTPPEIPHDKGSVVVTEGGKPRWSANWTMDPWVVAGVPAVRFTETGHGRYGAFTSEVNWTLEAIWKANDRFTPWHFEKTYKDARGNVVGTEKKDFDGKSVHLEKRNAAGHLETKSLAIPDDTITGEGIAGILRYLPFESGGIFTTHLLSNEPRLYDVTLEPRGRERVHTPAGDFECYKIELVPHLGMLNVFKGFFARTYFWFTVASPHTWVRYEGYENGVGSPQIVMERAVSASGPVR